MIKQASRLYTYLPKDNTADIDGILSTVLTEDGWKKYQKRTGKQTKDEVLKTLDSWEPDWNRSRAISVLSQPIPVAAAEDLSRFANESELYSFDLDDLIKADLVKNLRKTHKGPGTYAVDTISEDKINWNRKPKKLTFYGIPHYMVEPISGKIPPEFIKKEDRQDKYTIHGAILGCLGNNAKKFDYNITEKLPNDPWKAIINTKPMTMEQVQQFHKYHKKDVDKAGVPYYFLTRNERTGDKAVWYSDDATPLPINNKKEIEYAQQVGRDKGLVPDQLNFKFTKESKAINFPEDELANLKGKEHFYTTRVSSDYDKYNLGDTVTTPWGDAYDIVSEDKYNNLKDHKFYDELTDDQKRLLATYKKIKLLGLTKKASAKEYDIEKARKFVEAVRQMARRRKLNVFVLTDGASGVSNNGNPAIRNARDAQIQWELENGYDPYEDWGQKQASKLYTYVDPKADLSLGLLSLRQAPEDAAIRRYGRHVEDPKNLNKEYIVKQIDDFDPGRPDWIYGLDAPIPDYANEGLLRFRNSRKLVSWDPEKIKDIVKILRRYHRKRTREEVPPNFEPLKHVQWRRIPKDRTAFRYAPVYKILTESGRIPPEVLHYE